jgi:porphyrinogen peroxidase
MDGESVIYFIGFRRAPRITETMLQNMFVGRPPGNYHRLVDFSKPVSGSLFFAPSSTFLDNISGDAPNSTAIGALLRSDAPSASPVGDTSLRTQNRIA